MEVQFTPEMEKKLNDLAAQTGCGAGDLVRNAVAGYMDDLAGVGAMLDGRYDDLKRGRVTPIDGEEFFESLRQREEELLHPHPPK